jgi:hypothetical protein
MTWKKRIAALAVAATLGAGGVVAPAVAASSSKHWTTKQCTSYVKKFDKKHKTKKATSSQKKKANATLKKHGCKAKVK